MIDLDNTLGNRTGAVQSWIAEFCHERSLPVGAADWILAQDNDGYSARAGVFAAIKDHFDLVDAVEDLLLSYQDRVIELARPTSGAVECLAAVRQAGHTIAIVTNGSSKQQHAKIDRMELRPLVDAIIVSGDIDIKKPDPRIFEAAATATGKPLRGSWMVGDAALHDVVGGHQVGARTAWIRRGRQWTEPACTPTVVIDELTELSAAILAHD